MVSEFGSKIQILFLLFSFRLFDKKRVLNTGTLFYKSLIDPNNFCRVEVYDYNFLIKEDLLINQSKVLIIITQILHRMVKSSNSVLLSNSGREPLVGLVVFTLGQRSFFFIFF